MKDGKLSCWLFLCAMTSGCGSFPTGTFMVSFTITSNQCSFDESTDPEPYTIDVADDGTYAVTFGTTTVPVTSGNASHLTFTISTDSETIATCPYSEDDSYTLQAAGSNFTGTLIQSLTSQDTTGDPSCGSCTIQQTLSGRKTSD